VRWHKSPSRWHASPPPVPRPGAVGSLLPPRFRCSFLAKLFPPPRHGVQRRAATRSVMMRCTAVQLPRQLHQRPCSDGGAAGRRRRRPRRRCSHRRGTGCQWSPAGGTWTTAGSSGCLSTRSGVQSDASIWLCNRRKEGGQSGGVPRAGGWVAPAAARQLGCWVTAARDGAVSGGCGGAAAAVVALDVTDGCLFSGRW